MYPPWIVRRLKVRTFFFSIADRWCARPSPDNVWTLRARNKCSVKRIKALWHPPTTPIPQDMLFTDTPIVPFLNSLSKLSTQDIGMLQRGLMHEDIGVEDVGDLASLTNEHWSQVLALGGNPGKLSVVKFAAIKVAMRAVPTLHTFDFVGSNVQSLSPSRERKAKGHDTTNVYGDRPIRCKNVPPNRRRRHG